MKHETQAHIYNDVIHMAENINQGDIDAFVQTNLLETEKSVATIGNKKAMVYTVPMFLDSMLRSKNYGSHTQAAAPASL